MSKYKFSSAQKLNTSMESKKTKTKKNNTQATNNDQNTEKMLFLADSGVV